MNPKPTAMMIQALWTRRLAFSTRVGTSDHHELRGLKTARLVDLALSG
jgi:hypothetical protein